jgi:hypothetical protein
MAKFFEKFPIKQYNGVNCKHITTRTKLPEQVEREYSSFYELTVRDGERPDAISFKSYDDQYLDWLVYYSNRIIDPYYQWCLDEDSLNNSIIVKYGSLVEAREKIAFYRVKQSDDTLSLAAYNALTTGRKKYWSAQLNEVGEALYYKWIRHDHTVNTNRLIKIEKTLLETNLQNLQLGERVVQVVGGRVTASAQIDFIDNDSAVLKCVEGEFTVGNITGASSGITIGVGNVEEIGFTIPDDERAYWEPVTFYDYEVEQNEQYRNIRMLAPSLVDAAARSHEELLR